MAKKDREKSRDKDAKDKAKRVSPTQPKPRVKARKGAMKPREAPRELAVFDPDAVERVLDRMPDDDSIQSAADRLAGLAHPSRVKAVIALTGGELCVGDIAALVGLSLSATSTLLKQLRSIGFLTTRSAGKQIYYRLASRKPTDLLSVAFQAEE
jgi:DNA-binding transcriptional ArsR family regulator